MKKLIASVLLPLVAFTSCQGRLISYEKFHEKALEANELTLPYQKFDVLLQEDNPDSEKIEVEAHYELVDNEWVNTTKGLEDNYRIFIDKHFALQAYEVEQPVSDERYIYYVDPLKVTMEIGPQIVTYEDIEKTSFDVFNLVFNEYGYLSYLKYENRMTFVEGRNTTSKIYRITMNITYID